MAASPSGLARRLLSRAEMWIVDLNARNHPLFRLYDAFNEAWAALVFRDVKRKAAALDVTYPGRDAEFRIRFLTPDDEEAFADLLRRYSDNKYQPPHPTDPETARRALRRHSYLVFGIFHEGRLVANVLVRLFFPKRAVTGGWEVKEIQGRGLGKGAIKATGDFTTSLGFKDYITAPIDNPFSRKAAEAAGWKVVRTNPRFHLLLRR